MPPSTGHTNSPGSPTGKVRARELEVLGIDSGREKSRDLESISKEAERAVKRSKQEQFASSWYDLVIPQAPAAATKQPGAPEKMGSAAAEDVCSGQFYNCLLSKSRASDPDASRSFQGAELPNLLQLLRRCHQVPDSHSDCCDCMKCTIEVIGVRDFAYDPKVGPDDKEDRLQLEREVWIVDHLQRDGGLDLDTADRVLIVLHIHTPTLWRDAQLQAMDERDWSRITQMNIRHSRSYPMMNKKGDKLQFAAAPERGRAEGTVDGRPAFKCHWLSEEGFRWPEGSQHSVPLIRRKAVGLGGWPWREGVDGPGNYVGVEAKLNNVAKSKGGWKGHLIGPASGGAHMVDGHEMKWDSNGKELDGVCYVQQATLALLHAIEQIVQSGQAFRGIGEAKVEAQCSETEVLAFCLGMDEYQHATSLRHCVADASQMARAFRCLPSSVGYEITQDEGSDVDTREGILDAVDDDETDGFCQQIEKQGSRLRAVVIYAACHALQLGSDIYLVPQGASMKKQKHVPSLGVPLREIVAKVIDAVIKGRISDPSGSERCTCVFIMDTCRDDGAFGTNPAAATAEEMVPQYAKEVRVRDHCHSVFMFSTTLGSQASDNSPYTRAILANLFEPGKTLAEVHQNAVVAMQGTGQQPSKTVIGSDGLILVPDPVLVPDAPYSRESLAEDKQRPIVLHGVPGMSPTVAPRAKIIAELEHKLLETNDDLVFLAGHPGAGKTTLATFLCHESRAVRCFFRDGVIWLHVGRDFQIQATAQLQIRLLSWLLHSEEDSLKDVLERARLCGGMSSSDSAKYPNQSRLRDELERLMDQTRFLIVMDDVWDYDILRRALPCSSLGGSKVIVTTQQEDLIPTATPIKVIMVDEDTACLVLLQQTKCNGTLHNLIPEQQEWVRKLLSKCSGHVHTLALCGGMINSELTNLHAVYRKLEKGKIKKNGAVFNALSASFQDLADTNWEDSLKYASACPDDEWTGYDEWTGLHLQEFLCDLAVFPVDERISHQTLYMMQQHDQGVIDEMIECLCSRSLLGTVDGQLLLHGNTLDFLLHHCKDTIAERHNKFLQAYDDSCHSGVWNSRPQGGYFDFTSDFTRDVVHPSGIKIIRASRHQLPFEPVRHYWAEHHFEQIVLHTFDLSALRCWIQHNDPSVQLEAIESAARVVANTCTQLKSPTSIVQLLQTVLSKPQIAMTTVAVVTLLSSITQHQSSNEIKRDRKLVLEALRQDGYALVCATVDLRNDREIVSAAVLQDPGALEHASKDLKNDKDFMLEVVAQWGGYALEFASRSLQGNKEVVSQAIAAGGAGDCALIFASSELRGNRRFVLDAVKSRCLLPCDLPLWNDRVFVLELLNQDNQDGGIDYLTGNSILELVSEDLRSDCEIVSQVVQRHGESLEFAPTRWRSHKKIVLEAVKQSGYALEFASKELQGDKGVVLEAVKQEGGALEFASKELQGDKKFMLEAVTQDITAFEFASKELQSDEKFISEFSKAHTTELDDHLQSRNTDRLMMKRKAGVLLTGQDDLEALDEERAEIIRWLAMMDPAIPAHLEVRTLREKIRKEMVEEKHLSGEELERALQNEMNILIEEYKVRLQQVEEERGTLVQSPSLFKVVCNRHMQQNERRNAPFFTGSFEDSQKSVHGHVASHASQQQNQTNLQSSINELVPRSNRNPCKSNEPKTCIDYKSRAIERMARSGVNS